MANKADAVKRAVQDALTAFNQLYGKSYDFGDNWSNEDPKLQRLFIYNNLFPKLSETMLIDIALGNRFNWLAVEDPKIGQYSEEYVILDTIPVGMDLSKNVELMLKRNYPRIATKFYGPGCQKKVKFTLNDNDVRFSMSTIADAVSYATGVYRKSLSDINLAEEQEWKAALVDYALNFTTERRQVTSEAEMFDAIALALLNLQNNTTKYNEAALASGGAVGRFTTVTDINNIMILTTDDIKVNFLNSKLANTYQSGGIDFTKRIMSFDDLGGAWKANKDFQIANVATIDVFRSMGDYQIAIGDTILQDEIFTFDVSQLTEFVGNVDEVKPQYDLFAYIVDVNKVRYKRNTNNMFDNFYNPEFQETNNWLHYYSKKIISPFMNNVLLYGNREDSTPRVIVESGNIDTNVSGSVTVSNTVTTQGSTTIENTDANPVPTREVTP